MKQKLKCLSEKTADALYADVEVNIDRYKVGSFEDLATSYGWSVELQIHVDLDPLRDLNSGKGAENEIQNALLVWHAMSDLTPSLACENRIWTRLTHLEGLSFSRERWLKTASHEDVVKVVKDHFFANSRTKWRDDNALSRLWWIAYIASQVSTIDQKTVLQFILEKADIRSNFVERPWISSRPKLATGIIRAMMKDKWVTEKEVNYRSFMKQINKYGGGILFEAWNDADLDGFIANCMTLARADS
jgi:hypothetical protein